MPDRVNDEGITMTTIERNIIRRIASNFSKDRDFAEPMAIVCDIQMALGCSYGESLNLANAIRIGKYKSKIKTKQEKRTIQ